MNTTRIPIILATLVAVGCAESAVTPTESDGATPQASVGRVTHRATVGGPDACVAFDFERPGCDADFSLVALQGTRGVEGEWHDQFAGGFGIHVAVNCLNVIGNQAWISGVITASRLPGAVGLDAVTSVLDVGRSANDAADSISLSVIDVAKFGVDCNTAPGFGFPLFAAPEGQAVVVQ